MLIACHSSDRSDQAASSEGSLGSALGDPRFLQIQATAWQLSVSHPHSLKGGVYISYCGCLDQTEGILIIILNGNMFL